MATNLLQDVATYQMANTSLLYNSNFFINKANKKFKDFENFTANLGATVDFELAPRFSTEASLAVSSFQGTTQRKQSLTLDRAHNVAVEFTSPERLLNVDDYMDRIGQAAMAELASKIEIQTAADCVNHTYRAFGNGTTDITTYQQLAQAVANYKDYGAPKGKLVGVIPGVKNPAIVGDGLQRFAPVRNDEIANSWELGSFAGVDWYESNLLPTHTAGTLGQAGTTLTVVSINAAGTQITLSGAANNDSDAIKTGDILTFQDNVSGHPNMRFLTFIGHNPCSQPVQFRSNSNYGSDGAGNVVINIFPALVSTSGSKDQNLNNPIAAGMEIKVLPSHQCGFLFYQPALFLAMPRLPDQTPFPTGNKMDVDSGCSMRTYYGSKFGEDLTGFIHDSLTGSTLIDEQAMRLVFVP